MTTDATAEAGSYARAAAEATRKANGQTQRHAQRQPPTQPQPINDLVASFQQAVVDVLVTKTLRAAKKYKCKNIALAGGAAANSRLRKEMEERGKGEGIEIMIPPIALCTDNAAMVGARAYYLLKEGKTSNFELPAVASLRL